MGSLNFSAEAIKGLIVEGALMMLIPVVIFVIWKLKTRESFMPALIGAAAWFIFAIAVKTAPAYLLFQSAGSLSDAINGNVWISCLIAAVLAGVLEESGRYLAFRFVLKTKTDRRTAITYGIGHGGFESIYIGFQLIALAALMIVLQSGIGEKIMAQLDEETASLLVSQLKPYAGLTFADCLPGVFERLPAIAVHISLSVFVFASVSEKSLSYLFSAAIFIHTLFDFSIVLYQAEIISLWPMEALLAVFAAAVAYAASRIYKKLRADVDDGTAGKITGQTTA